ncbi:MAG: DNA mismatch repair protein MutS, partial [Pseudomonadota bacterium]
LAWADISTGTLHVAPCPRVRLGPELARLGIRELILAEGTALDDVVEEQGAAATPLGKSAFDSGSAEVRLKALFDVGSLEAFGAFGRSELGAMGALVEYVELTQRGRLPLMRPPRREAAGELMAIDAATRRNLELVRGASGSRDGSLLWAVDRTVTAGGGRLLERRVSAPSTVEGVIRARLNAVDWAVQEDRLAADICETLRRTPDMDRSLSRLSLDRGGPRDLAAIRDGLTAGETLFSLLSETDLPLDITDLIGTEDLLALLNAALVAEPPLMLRDGGCIAADFDPDLDEARKLRDEGRGVIAALQKTYAEATGVGSLKIKHNNVLGYFVEVTAIHDAKLRSQAEFIHRQTTANQVRFTTVELSELQTKILNAGARAQDIEERVFARLKQAVLEVSDSIFAAARILAELDVTTALADLARGEGWCRPRVNGSRIFEVAGGRHPVVEKALKREGTPFVANETRLSADEGAAIRLLTGPNMAGKSTWLRQNALIAVLAQMGSFVPAEAADIGIVSQLFSRVGASDDLARGRSTFMVEMVETAAILNQADERALVILDEIGRGTATYDGLSIAWATLEHLHDVNKCRALFATHYHEMTALAAKLDGVENATVAVREWEGDVIFLHEVREGAADRSYGVQVAKLAGLPEAVVARAREVLDALEQGEREGGSKAVIDDLPLFSVTPSPPPAPIRESAVEERLRDILPDALTPKEALDLVYELKGKMA